MFSFLVDNDPFVPDTVVVKLHIVTVATAFQAQVKARLKFLIVNEGFVFCQFF